MSANNLAPIIIKRKKIVGGDAHHGGAWKVAYADFVTAMMAFFLLMWLLNATTESQRKGIADYFNPSIPLSRVSGGGDGSFGGDSVFTEKTLAQNGAGGSKTKPTAQRAARGQLGADARLDEAPPAEDAALAAVEAELMGHGGESMSSELDMRHVITRLSDEGLVVEVFDLEGEPLFDPMTHEPTQAMKDITALFATVFQLVTNKIAINGHVSSRPVVARDTRIWDTSTMRAQIVRGLYHRAECLTHVGDSQAVRSLTQCGEPMRFAMAAPIDLRNDFDSVSLRRLAKRTRDATQSRRLLALAEVYDGGSRTDASRIGGVGLQIIRDWVLRFNARGPDGLVDGKSPGAPSKLNADHRRALAEVVEAGPVPAVDGVVRWRRKDLARWLLETFAISLDETTVGRELKALGFAKISARPRHYAQNELAVEAFKKTSPPNWRRSGRGSRKASR